MGDDISRPRNIPNDTVLGHVYPPHAGVLSGKHDINTVLTLG